MYIYIYITPKAIVKQHWPLAIGLTNSQPGRILLPCLSISFNYESSTFFAAQTFQEVSTPTQLAQFWDLLVDLLSSCGDLQAAGGDQTTINGLVDGKIYRKPLIFL